MIIVEVLEVVVMTIVEVYEEVVEVLSQNYLLGESKRRRTTAWAGTVAHTASLKHRLIVTNFEILGGALPLIIHHIYKQRHK